MYDGHEYIFWSKIRQKKKRFIHNKSLQEIKLWHFIFHFLVIIPYSRHSAFNDFTICRYLNIQRSKIIFNLTTFFCPSTEYFLTIIFLVSIDFKTTRKLPECENICVMELLVIELVRMQPSPLICVRKNSRGRGIVFTANRGFENQRLWGFCHIW